MTQLLDDEKVVLSEEGDDDKYIHLVHAKCHEGEPRPPFVTSMCGIALAWDEKRDDNVKEDCPDCEAAFRCPHCKAWRIVR